MKADPISPPDDLANLTRSLSAFVLSHAGSVEAAKNLTGFVALLGRLDQEQQKDGGSEDASDGSGHRVHQAQGRVNRVRERCPR